MYTHLRNSHFVIFCQMYLLLYSHVITCTSKQNGTIVLEKLSKVIYVE